MLNIHTKYLEEKLTHRRLKRKIALDTALRSYKNKRWGAVLSDGIVDELVPITRELRELYNKARRPKIVSVPRIGVKRDIESQPQSKRILVAAYGPLAETFLQKYMDSDKKQVDTTFGIRYDNGVPMIGGKVIMIDGDNIAIDDDEIYVGTLCLWSPITDNVLKNYDERDLERYKELLHKTSTLYQDYDPYNKYPRASRSKNILGPIWNEFQFTGLVSEDSDDDTLQ